MAVYSPRLDRQGNRIRGLKVCGELSRHFGLHVLGQPNNLARFRAATSERL